mgnify:CR=1 FL=1
MKLPENFGLLAGCTAGIMVFFLVYGVVQERVMTRPYGEDEERFKDTGAKRVHRDYACCICL